MIKKIKKLKTNGSNKSNRVLTCGGQYGDALTAIDMFSGCGGLTYGLRQAKFNVLAAIELDAKAMDAYKLNHPRVPVVLNSDIRSVSARALMSSTGLCRGELDLLAGCPPCQGFSTLRTNNGKRSNRDDRNRLLLEMGRFVRALLPKVVMIENVPGLEKKSVFQQFVKELRKEGYKPKWAIQDVQEYGVPQRRKRLVMIAGRKFDVDFAKEARSQKTVRMAIGNLPPAGNSGDLLHDFPENRTLEMRRWIALVPKDGGGRNDLPDKMQRPCHNRTTGFKDVYGRMAWDDVAPTITGGCFNPSKGRFLHPIRNRNITMREAALLQTFPHSFRLPRGTTKIDAALMIGNALPPEFVRRQALAIRKNLYLLKNK